MSDHGPYQPLVDAARAAIDFARLYDCIRNSNHKICMWCYAGENDPHEINCEWLLLRTALADLDAAPPATDGELDLVEAARKMRDAGGSGWDGVDVEATIAELRGNEPPAPPAGTLADALEKARATMVRVLAQYHFAADAGRYPWGLGIDGTGACDTFDGGPRGFRWLMESIEQARAALDAHRTGGGGWLPAGEVPRIPGEYWRWNPAVPDAGVSRFCICGDEWKIDGFERERWSRNPIPVPPPPADAGDGSGDEEVV